MILTTSPRVTANIAAAKNPHQLLAGKSSSDIVFLAMSTCRVIATLDLINLLNFKILRNLSYIATISKVVESNYE